VTLVLEKETISGEEMEEMLLGSNFYPQKSA